MPVVLAVIFCKQTQGRHVSRVRFSNPEGKPSSQSREKIDRISPLWIRFGFCVKICLAKNHQVTFAIFFCDKKKGRHPSPDDGPSWGDWIRLGSTLRYVIRRHRVRVELLLPFLESQLPRLICGHDFNIVLFMLGACDFTKPEQNRHDCRSLVQK